MKLSGILPGNVLRITKLSTLCVVLACISFCSSLPAKVPFSYPPPGLINPALVYKFYALNTKQPGWFSNPSAFSVIRQRFIQVLDNAAYLGLNKNKYHYAEIVASFYSKDTSAIHRHDMLFLDGIISYSKDLFAGFELNRYIINDEISPEYANADNDYLIGELSILHSGYDIDKLFALLEPTDLEYLMLKTALKGQLDSQKIKTTLQLQVCLNLLRWIHHFHFPQFIVVNIPSATLRYYESEIVKLQMKVVAGKPSTRTPRFSAYCNEVILYPYWNVPRSIIVKELLPKFKKSPAAIDEMNMQVVTGAGKVIDHHSFNWSQYSGKNFPYNIRQGTGCDNSLGVIKFNLTDPFDVYMHDTNFKKAFAKSSRFLSHGCIRLEKPTVLGNLLLNNKLDTDFVKACIQGQTPVVTKLSQPVPVFVVYMPASVDSNNKVIFHKDIYRQF